MPSARAGLGIDIACQDLALFDNLDPAANFYAGREPDWPAYLPRSLRGLLQGRVTSDLACFAGPGKDVPHAEALSPRVLEG